MTFFTRKNGTSGTAAAADSTAGARRIVEEIAADADREAASIIEEAEKITAERHIFAGKKAESITADAADKAQQQAQRVRQGILSGLSVAVKRERMRMQDQLLRDIQALIRKKCAALVKRPGYPSILTDWIIEAAIGLEAPNAVVNTSAAERSFISEAMLKEISGRLSREYGVSCELHGDSGEPLDDQGIVVTAADGRTAFNNQVVTRMRRMEQQIRDRVYEALFTDTLPSGRQGRETAEP